MARDTGFSPEVKQLVEARSGGSCEAMFPECVFTASEIHHRVNRGMGTAEKSGGTEAALHLCFACHRTVTESPAMAYRLGMLVHRNRVEAAADVPVRWRGRWVLLDSVGGVIRSSRGVA